MPILQDEVQQNYVTSLVTYSGQKNETESSNYCQAIYIL